MSWTVHWPRGVECDECTVLWVCGGSDYAIGCVDDPLEQTAGILLVCQVEIAARHLSAGVAWVVLGQSEWLPGAGVRKVRTHEGEAQIERICPANLAMQE